MTTTTHTRISPPRTLTLHPALRLEYEALHANYGAVLHGVDFSKPMDDDIMDEIKRALGHYGVICFRNTGMTDQDFVELGGRFGQIVDVPPSRRFPTLGLSDPSNLYLDGSIVKPGELRWFMAKETALFHVDTSYDAHRVRLTSIIARKLPPAGTGGATEYSDTRTAYDDLDEETRRLLEDKVGVHSHFHSRKVAVPNFPTFAALDPWKYPMSKHKIVQTHRESGRKALYIASHLHHIEGMDPEESTKLILRLRQWVEQPKYIMKVYYQQPGDVVIWDNQAVLHRAGGNEGEGWAGKYVRDIRKWMVFYDEETDPEQWGLNARETPKFLAGPVIQATHDEIYGPDGKVYDFDED